MTITALIGYLFIVLGFVTLGLAKPMGNKYGESIAGLFIAKSALIFVAAGTILVIELFGLT